jgi:small-conductance mechanosensitive channel
LAFSTAAAVLGYVTMAAILMGETIWIATVLASLFLLLRLADDLFPVLLAAHRPFGRFLRTAIGLSEGAVDQAAVLFSGAARLLLLLFGWAAILAPFGAGAGEVFMRITTSQLVIRVGQVSISPGAVVGALAMLLGGLVLTRMVRRWLERSYLPKTTMDIGLRTSLASGVTYLGALLAVLLAFGYLGLSFDRIALFASALSVGVGFGLQAVIGNFVSGLILLAERPIRVGDWIAIGELEGDVKKINVRATEIEMQDRSKLIVPNSDLISKTVRNVTHAGSLGRIKIVIKTTDAADPAAVRALVLGRLAAHPHVREEPPPSVYLTGVGEGALEFTGFAYVDSPRLAYAARSDILFQIVPELRAKGVELARAGPVVNLSLAERPIEPSAPGRS